jgi:hypothetical protein
LAGGALALAEEDRLSPRLCFARLARVELAVDPQLGRGREVEQLLELGHEVDLAAALQGVDPLLGGDDGVAVEIGRALLELREVLHALQGPLGAEQAPDVHPAQAGGLDAPAELLGPDAADEVERRVRVAVGMAIETGRAAARPHGAPVLGLVELLLRERREQGAKP